MRYSLGFSAQELFEMLKDEKIVRDRLEAGKRLDQEVLFHGSSKQGIRIVTKAQIHKEDLPGWMAPRFPDGGPVNEREENWSDASGVSARVEVTSPTGGATFSGVYTVVDSSSGSTWRVQGQATFPNLFVGKRVESFMLKNLDIAFRRESGFLNAKLAHDGARE